MIKTSDFIHHNSSIPDFDDEMLNSTRHYRDAMKRIYEMPI
jgi:hypothetical protein